MIWQSFEITEEDKEDELQGASSLTQSQQSDYRSMICMCGACTLLLVVQSVQYFSSYILRAETSLPLFYLGREFISYLLRDETSLPLFDLGRE
mmetsp:Transcript_19812/g.32873  ORF Transcript_19812/g.32873 Transcript_19812/m.32873 type:complete len:93 (-) Transcript_19812:127-405(-)